MRAEDRREQLVQAAIRVVERDGVAATTTRSIAAEAGVNLATLHYCFASKQELLQQVMRAIIHELSEAASIPVSCGESVDALLRGALHGLWEVIEREPRRQQVTYEFTAYCLRTPGMEALARWQYEVYYDQCAAQLAYVAGATGVTWSIPMALMSRMLLTAIDGVVLGWLVDRDSELALKVLDGVAGGLAAFARPESPQSEVIGAGR